MGGTIVQSQRPNIGTTVPWLTTGMLRHAISCKYLPAAVLVTIHEKTKIFVQMRQLHRVLPRTEDFRRAKSCSNCWNSPCDEADRHQTWFAAHFSGTSKIVRTSDEGEGFASLKEDFHTGTRPHPTVTLDSSSQDKACTVSQVPLSATAALSTDWKQITVSPAHLR
jgi:hypothetical protein